MQRETWNTWTHHTGTWHTSHKCTEPTSGCKSCNRPSIIHQTRQTTHQWAQSTLHTKQPIFTYTYPTPHSAHTACRPYYIACATTNRAPQSIQHKPNLDNKVRTKPDMNNTKQSWKHWTTNSLNKHFWTKRTNLITKQFGPITKLSKPSEQDASEQQAIWTAPQIWTGNNLNKRNKSEHQKTWTARIWTARSNLTK